MPLPQCHARWHVWVRGGGTDLERGYGDVRPWRPPFHASPAARKGPISSKRVSSQDPLLRKFGNFSLYSLFCPNFSSQAPKFENFELTSLQIWKLSAHNPPNLEIFSSQAPLFRGKYPFASPRLQKSGPHTPTWKKVECSPPRGLSQSIMLMYFKITKVRRSAVTTPPSTDQCQAQKFFIRLLVVLSSVSVSCSCLNSYNCHTILGPVAKFRWMAWLGGPWTAGQRHAWFCRQNLGINCISCIGTHLWITKYFLSYCQIYFCK